MQLKANAPCKTPYRKFRVKVSRDRGPPSKNICCSKSFISAERIISQSIEVDNRFGFFFNLYLDTLARDSDRWSRKTISESISNISRRQWSKPFRDKGSDVKSHRGRSLNDEGKREKFEAWEPIKQRLFAGVRDVGRRREVYEAEEREVRKGCRGAFHFRREKSSIQRTAKLPASSSRLLRKS